MIQTIFWHIKSEYYISPLFKYLGNICLNWKIKLKTICRQKINHRLIQ